MVLRPRAAVAASLMAAAFAACSVRPMPDDVSPIPTEEIVRSARCETKAAVRDIIRKVLVDRGLIDVNPEAVLDPDILRRVQAAHPDLAAKFQAYGASAIAYTFDFRITEKNNAEASVGFKLPLVNGDLSAGAAGKANKIRQGQREFSSVETFAGLAKLDCRGVGIRDKNLVYPITGSTGVYEAMQTFISLSEIGGGKGNFTDTLTFVTRFYGEANAKLVLNPVPKTFRVVAAEGRLDAEREDIHKVTVSFAFPEIDLRPTLSDGTTVLLQPTTARLRQLSADAVTRAVVNLCIARARDREVEFGTLRQLPPEDYCRRGGQQL